MDEYRIFVSYSRTDLKIVGPLVQLLRTADERIFRDVDSIPPGGRWRAFLTGAIDGCELLLLFWCRHSSKSLEVKKEYKHAIERTKRIVPILLDHTYLPAELSEYQAIDLRQVLGDHEQRYVEVEEQASGARPRSSGAVRRWELLTPNDQALHDGSWCLREALGRIVHGD